MNIAKNIQQYLNNRDPFHSNSSFDYCYNYFQSFREKNRLEHLSNPEQIQCSSYQLGFYLASWGMLRASSFLAKKSVKIYERIIERISKFDRKIWEIGVEDYTDNNIELLMDCKEIIKEEVFSPYGKPSETLITKIMLGVFGNVPAYDNFFKIGYRNIFNKSCSFREESLKNLKNFYENNKKKFDNCKINTIELSNGNKTKRIYPIAKLIDMVIHIEGRS